MTVGEFNCSNPHCQCLYWYEIVKEVEIKASPCNNGRHQVLLLVWCKNRVAQGPVIFVMPEFCIWTAKEEPLAQNP